MSKCYLEYEREGAKRKVLLDDETFRFDRSSQSAIALSDDPTVSLRHAMVQRLSGGDFYLCDLNSRNGTMLNGRPISVPTLLRAGDVIKVGTYELVFHLEDGEALGPVDTGDSATKLVVSRRLITVLVADIKGYTRLTLELGESFICEVVGTLFKEAGHVLNANGAWGQKYIGDALMGIWIHEHQIPSRREFELIFRSLAGIRRTVAKLNQRNALAEAITFGTGINTGYAAIGNMGSKHFPDYTALGDSVNKAFRLESATRDLKLDVILGGLTYDFLSALTDTRTGFAQHRLHLKGYPQAEVAYGTDFATIETVLR